jgi:hypothetical protein
MRVAEALRVLGLDAGPDGVDARSVRQSYLRRALEVHPDKRGAGAGDGEFQRVKEAYDVAMSHVGGGGGEGGGGGDAIDIDVDDDLLMRAFRGEDVREELARRGGWRPGDAFGVDFEERWGAPRGAPRGERECEGGAWRDELEEGLRVVEDGDGGGEDGGDDG